MQTTSGGYYQFTGNNRVNGSNQSAEINWFFDGANTTQTINGSTVNLSGSYSSNSYCTITIDPPIALSQILYSAGPEGSQNANKAAQGNYPIIGNSERVFDYTYTQSTKSLSSAKLLTNEAMNKKYSRDLQNNSKIQMFYFAIYWTYFISAKHSP